MPSKNIKIPSLLFMLEGSLAALLVLGGQDPWSENDHAHTEKRDTTKARF